MFLKTLHCSRTVLLHRLRITAELPSNGSTSTTTSSRGFYGSAAPRISAGARVVDLRSDAVTRPGPEMRRAMSQAKVGDDFLGEDPTVNELQRLTAEMFGMEAALFVPSGTMSNLIAVMVHCRERGDEMILGDLSHSHIYEQGGSAQLAGVHSTTVTTLPDGTFDLEQLQYKVRHGFPRSRLICVENTHNIQGGRVLPLRFLQQVRSLADQYDLKVHMDGARVMNAAVALGVSPKTILQHTHTVSVGLCKGLGSPFGAMLVGPSDFISRAVRCRKALGGAMGQVGIIAAAGIMSLCKMVPRLEEDHRNARTFAQALLDCSPSLFSFDVSAVETNIVRFRLGLGLSPGQFCARMSEVQDGEEAMLGQGVQVLMCPYYGNTVRAVWHLDVSSEDTHWAVRKMQYVAAQFMKDKAQGQLQ